MNFHILASEKQVTTVVCELVLNVSKNSTDLYREVLARNYIPSFSKYRNYFQSREEVVIAVHPLS